MKTPTITLVVLLTAVTLTSVAAAGHGAGRAEHRLDNRLSLAVKGIRFSLEVPSDWEFHARHSFVSKSIVGPQGAEAVVFWTEFPEGGHARPCAELLGPTQGRSIVALAVSMARTPGTTAVRLPTRVTVDGRSARYLALRIRKDVGCNPGFFFSWRADLGGAFWTQTRVGDTVRVWIVSVNGRLLVLEAVTSVSNYRVERTIRQIVESIRFG